MPRLFVFLLFSSLAACAPDRRVAEDDAPADDDDDVTADDDDSANDDDDDDDDSANDDETTVDLRDAFIPTFDGGCVGTRFRAVLGDGTELSEVEGYLADSSESNTAPPLQLFHISLGTIDGQGAGSLWVDVGGFSANLTGPGTYEFDSSSAFSVWVSAYVGTDHAPGRLAGGFSVLPSADDDVRGSVTFVGGVPEPNVPISGNYEAILQGGTQSFDKPDQVILLGVAGCFTDIILPQGD